MRGALVLLISACGRIGFDEVERGDDVPEPDAAAARCDVSFQPVANAPLRYRFEPGAASWPTALAACRAFGPGHSLALPATDAERVALSAEARATVVARWWIGGTDAAVEGTWLDPDGLAIAYLPWAQSEPNNTGGNEHCLDLLSDPVEGPARTDLFDDRSCAASLRLLALTNRNRV